ncbi:MULTISPECIES: hypothetical protein [unclassified Paraburkholderia]
MVRDHRVEKEASRIRFELAVGGLPVYGGSPVVSV